MTRQDQKSFIWQSLSAVRAHDWLIFIDNREMTDTAVCGPDPEIVDIALGFFLIVGTVAAYIPQVNQ